MSIHNVNSLIDVPCKLPSVSALTEFIKDRLEEMGRTQDDLAACLGLTPSHVSKVLSSAPQSRGGGFNKISVKTGTEWARCLRLDGKQRVEFLSLVLMQGADSTTATVIAALTAEIAELNREKVSLSMKLGELGAEIARLSKQRDKDTERG